MSLICFASQKGSPGVTATSLAVAAALHGGDGRSKVFLEADVSGGSVALRYRLAPEPGLLTLAAASRGTLDNDTIWEHCQQLPGGLPALASPVEPLQVSSALDAAGADIGKHLAGRDDVIAIADIGRLSLGSAALGLVGASTALLLVARPRPEELQAAASQVSTLTARPANVGWILIGDKPYGAREVENTFGMPVVGVVADDQRSIQAFSAGVSPRKLRRQPFLRTCSVVAQTLSTWMATPSPSQKQNDSWISPNPTQETATSWTPATSAQAPDPSWAPPTPAQAPAPTASSPKPNGFLAVPPSPGSKQTSSWGTPIGGDANRDSWSGPTT